MSFKEQKPYSEEEARDARRKADIRQIITAQEMYYGKNGYYLKSLSLKNGGTPAIPDYLDEMHEGKEGHPDYVWLNNTKDSSNSKFCVYAELEQGGYYAGSHKGKKILDSSPKNLSCW